MAGSESIIKFPLAAPKEWAVAAEFRLPEEATHLPSLPQQLVDHVGLTSLAAFGASGIVMVCAVEAPTVNAAEEQAEGVLAKALEFLSLPTSSVVQVEVTPMYLGK